MHRHAANLHSEEALFRAPSLTKACPTSAPEKIAAADLMQGFDEFERTFRQGYTMLSASLYARPRRPDSAIKVNFSHLKLNILVRRHPGPGFALGHGDLDLGHYLGDLAAKLDRVGAAFQGSEIEPFMRGDEIDHAGTPAGPVQTALEQYVGDRACCHRYCRIQIDVPLKHLTSPFLFLPPCARPAGGPCPLVETSRYSPTPFAGLLG
jgi:hypothetical protein